MRQSRCSSDVNNFFWEDQDQEKKVGTGISLTIQRLQIPMQPRRRGWMSPVLVGWSSSKMSLCLFARKSSPGGDPAGTAIDSEHNPTILYRILLLIDRQQRYNNTRTCEAPGWTQMFATNKSLQSRSVVAFDLRLSLHAHGPRLHTHTHGACVDSKARGLR